MANEEKLPVAKEKELWLMGFRILVAEEEEEDGSMRKSWSMGNLSTTAPVGLLEDSNRDCGYLSEGNLDRPARKNTRKRGIPWTVEEHKTFLQGLEKLGKGDWRGISKNFVTTRTPTQVASHAQKYFLRQMNPHKRKRRSSLFDVAIDNKDKSSAANPAFTFRNAREMEEENEFPVHDNTTPIVQVPISTQASFSSHEASPSSERMTGSHAFLNHYHVNSKVESNDATNDKVISFQSKFLPDPSPSQAETSIIRSGSATCTLDFLELSINTTQLKTQEIETPFIQCSDLELHIGLPQPHLTTKVPFPNMQGTVRVI